MLHFPIEALMNIYFSAFVVWCTKEVSHFMSQLIRQVFVPQVSIAVLNKCVEHLRFYSEQVCLIFITLFVNYSPDYSCKSFI